MNPTENTPDFQEVAALWRAFLSQHAPTEPTVSADEAVAKLRQARERLERRWLPPKVTLPGELAAMLAGWQLDWTQELRTHAQWPSESARLAEARGQWSAGQYADARFTIASILSECCIGAQDILALPNVKARDPRQQPLSNEALRTGLDALLTWLESLRPGS